MEENVIVLSVKSYNFKNEAGGDVAGCTVHYFPAENLDAKEDTVNSVLGLQPLKATMSYDFYSRAKSVGIPCCARVRYAMRSQQGQMILKPEEFMFLPGKKVKE